MPNILDGPISKGTQIYHAMANIKNRGYAAFSPSTTNRAARGEVFDFVMVEPYLYALVETDRTGYHWRIHKHSLIFLNYGYENVEPHLEVKHATNK